MRYQEPEFLPWDGRRAPITFIGGYLGAGKTTVINALLARTDRRIAVLVNDVGAISIDAALIRRRNGDTIELADGCICCSLIDGFGAAFDRLRAREVPPEHVVVELSGVADPERVLPWGRSAGFVLDGTVIVAAADQLAGGVAPAAERAARIDATIDRQLAAADLVVLTKTDVVDAVESAAARRRIAVIAPHTPVFESAPAGSIATGSLLDLGGRQPGGAGAVSTPSLFDAHDVATVAMPSGLSRADVPAAVDRALAGVGGVVVRAKGVVTTAAGEPLLVQVVGARREITDLPLPEWQSATDLTVVTLRS